jgi:hypothetical protein
VKAYWGNDGIAPLILDLGTRWRWVASFTPRPLYPQGKNAWYSLVRRLSGPQSWSGRGGEEKNSQPVPGLKPQIIIQSYDNHPPSLCVWRQCVLFPLDQNFISLHDELNIFHIYIYIFQQKDTLLEWWEGWGMEHVWKRWEMLTKF